MYSDEWFRRLATPPGESRFARADDLRRIGRELEKKSVPQATKPAVPAPKPAPKAGGKKELYKIYGPQHHAEKGSSQVSTRVKGKVYVPAHPSKFKKGQQAKMNVSADGLDVTDPESGHTQKWKAFEALIREFMSLI